MVLTVEYAPGVSEPVHRHNAQAFVFVLVYLSNVAKVAFYLSCD
jgi:predicted metal-dependent enzyme (double-stranded beta helix superfamily)